MSLTKNSTPQAKNFFSSADEKTCLVFWAFYQVCSTDWTREIPVQSHVRFRVFFSKIPKADARRSVKNLFI